MVSVSTSAPLVQAQETRRSTSMERSGVCDVDALVGFHSIRLFFSLHILGMYVLKATIEGIITGKD